MSQNSYEKPDFWSKKAFSEGYPARSVYKLEEIDQKFSFIKKNSTVLDLGSAPGSWTTYLLRRMEGSLSPSITFLTSLEVLDLGGGHYTFTFEVVVGFHSLDSFTFSDKDLSGDL